MKDRFLRDYQQEIIARVHEAWSRHRSVMVQMPTGTGKTHVLAALVENVASVGAGKVLVVAHRIELIAQISETLTSFGIAHDVMGSTEFSSVTVASVQTISRRLERIEGEPELVIIDEAHHALARTYRVLWEKWPQAKFLGLTATPCRMNRAGFEDLFDVLVTSWSIAEFIEKGVLSVFDYVSIRPDSEEQRLIDSLEKRGSDGDYQVKEMNEVLNKRPSIERLYGSMNRFAKGKKGIVYAISIDHARQIAAHYSRMGVKTAAIDSRTPGEERKRLVECFKRGELQVLVNVDVFSEGFDCPDVEFVQMARPTLSLAKYLQQVGRGLRKSEGKVACMLIDNVGLYRRFGLPVVAWDWETMFRGARSGRGQGVARNEVRYAGAVREADMPMADMGLEMVISHDLLLSHLHELNELPSAVDSKMPDLKAWQDADTGFWGLRRGRERLTEAEYRSVFDIRKEWAAVRFCDNSCGLVEATGKVVWKRRNCSSLKFVRNNFLMARLEGGNECYVDLYNLSVYNMKPEVKRYEDFELLKVGHLCCSRTQETYVSKWDFDNLHVFCRKFYLCIYEPSGNYLCLLKGDRERIYQIHERLEDGSMVVTDRDGRFYHVAEGEEKVYIGCQDSDEQTQACREMMMRLAVQARENCRMQEAKKQEKRQHMIDGFKEAIPFQIGKKWGLKVGNRITVPPVYRNMKPPVGKYCAVEENYNQWGIIAIDGTVLVEPKYPEVVIHSDGTALLTHITGRTVSISLKK